MAQQCQGRCGEVQAIATAATGLACFIFRFLRRPLVGPVFAAVAVHIELDGTCVTGNADRGVTRVAKVHRHRVTPGMARAGGGAQLRRKDGIHCVGAVGGFAGVLVGAFMGGMRQ